METCTCRSVSAWSSKGFTPLRMFVLPAEVANGRAGAVDWTRFLDLARRCRMERVARFALAFMKDRLGAEVPEEVAAPGRRQRLLQERVAQALLGGPPIRQVTRLRLYSLFDSPGQVLRMWCERSSRPSRKSAGVTGSAAAGGDWRCSTR